MTEDEMVGWHHQLDGHEFEQDLGVGGGQALARVMGLHSFPSFLPAPQVPGKSIIQDWMKARPCRKGNAPRASHSTQIGDLMKIRLSVQAE